MPVKTLKLGKTPARPDAVKFRFAHYFLAPALPTPPHHFGYHNLYKKWKMFANDRWGDCVLAGAAHEEMAFHKAAGTSVSFTDKNVLSDYSAITGFNPEDPNSDRGTDMQEAASYRRHTGIIDSKSRRHLIEAYVGIELHSLDQLKLGMWLMGGAGIGLMLPSTALDQTERKQPWDVVPGATIAGGHYVSGLGWLPNGNIAAISWGRVQEMTPAFYLKYCDEVVIYLSKSRMRKESNLSPEGFRYEALESDLNTLKKP